MKRFYTLCVVLLVLSSLLLSAYAQDNGVGNKPPDPATWMPDPNLRNAVRAALRLNANEPLTQQKLLNLNVLNARRLRITDLTGLEYATNLRSLSVGGNQISDLTPLANLTRLTGLYIGDNPIGDITPLAHLTNLRRLGMLRNQVTDIRILADLVHLRYLRLAGNPITDTSPLESLPNLSDVDIEIPSLIPDANLRAAVRTALGIEPNLRITIDAMRSLTTLNLNVVQLDITDLTGLEYATNLTYLYIRNNLISDIAPLAHLTNLRVLSVGGNQISNLTPLANLIELTGLYMGDNLISDITPLANLTNLRRLGMLRNQVTDINVLAGLVNLKYLRLAGNPITNPCPLESLPNLSDVDIEIPSLIPDANLRAAVRTALGIEASACITIEAMQDLTTLNALRLGITDLTGLEYATNLRVLSVGGNQISNLTPLANLIGLTSLYIEYNLISDITPLANLTNLRRLGMLRNQITDIRILAGLVNLRYLRLAGNPITDTSPLRSLPGLTNVDVYIASPPQQVNPQPQGESTHFDIDPPQDDRRQEDSGQLQPQQPPTNQQPTTNPQQPTNQQPQQPQQQQPTNQQSQQPQQQQPTNQQPQQPQQQQPTNQQSQQPQQQQPTNQQPQQPQQQQPTNQQPQQPQQQQPTNQQSQQPQQQQPTIPPPESVVVPPAPEPEPEPPQTLPSTQLLEEERDYEAECIAQGGTWYDGVCVRVRRPTPQEFCEGLGGTWDDETETCDGVEGLAPSYPKNVFLLDRITLEQLDPATLEAQLDIWLAESDGSALYLRSIALLENVLATRHPDKTHLLPNYPNPFNPETWIPYHLANPSEVQITIYNTRGTVVRHLDLGHQQEGYYTSRSRAAYWDGCNDIGEKVSSGIYFYQFQTDNVSLLRKMVILK